MLKEMVAHNRRSAFGHNDLPGGPGDRDFQSDHASKLGCPRPCGGHDLSRAKGTAFCLNHKATIASPHDRASRGLRKEPGAVSSSGIDMSRRYEQRVRKTLALQETSADDVWPEIRSDRDNFTSRKDRTLDSHRPLGGYLSFDQPHFIWGFGNPQSAA